MIFAEKWKNSFAKLVHLRKNSTWRAKRHKKAVFLTIPHLKDGGWHTFVTAQIYLKILYRWPIFGIKLRQFWLRSDCGGVRKCPKTGQKPEFTSYIFAEFLEISLKLLHFFCVCAIIPSWFGSFANVLTLRKGLKSREWEQKDRQKALKQPFFGTLSRLGALFLQ